jgi:glycosyltransferase involved in cell wall biosynthesis
MKLTFCYEHLAPYHHVRLAAIQRRADVAVIDYGNVEGAAFDAYEGEKSYRAIRLDSSQHDAIALRKALDETAPNVLLLPGWGYVYALSALAWAIEREVPAVAISDSTGMDKPRNTFREALKTRIVRIFSSGLVAGKRSGEYLVKLGLPRERIFQGCDVVDNRHFEEGAQTARNIENSLREKLRLPQKYFLAVSQFIPEKNLIHLLQAYARYRKAGAPGNWQLVLVGSGELKEELSISSSDLSINTNLFFVGKKNYDELPAYYGLAGAFVLPSVSETWGLVVNEAMAAGLPVLVSERCGCADDLVKEGMNGYTFNPYNIDALTQHMLRMAGGVYELNAMAQASRKIISRWTVEFCAENTLKAAEAALNVSRPKVNMLDKMIIKVALKKLLKNV